MSFENEAKKVEASGKAAESALSVPIVKYAVVAVLIVVVMLVGRFFFLR